MSGEAMAFLKQGFKMAPASNLLGWDLVSLDVEKGEIAVAFTARPDFVNPHGVVQGGFITAMIDDTMGALGFIHTRGPATTLELKTSFLRAARPGRMLARARIVRAGRDIIFMEGTLEDAAGSLLATMSATMKKLAPRDDKESGEGRE